MKMKKLWLPPRIKSLSPHMANGDKVRQRCSKIYAVQFQRVYFGVGNK
jgi:hypothetical protein